MLLFLLGSLNVWGADVTFTFNTSEGLNALGITEPNANSQTYISSAISVSPVTITPAKNGATNYPGVFKNSAGTSIDLRLYKYTSGSKGSGVIISVSDGYKLTGISGLWTSKVAASNGTLSSGSWTPANNSTTTSVEIYNNTSGKSGGSATKCTVITISYESTGGGSTQPTLSVEPATIDFGTVEQGAPVESKTVAVSFENLTGSVTYSELTSPFSANGTISSTGDEITIAANTATIGEYSQTLTVQSADDNKSAEVTVKMNVVAPFDGLKLTFDVSSNPGEWPTTNDASLTNYTYALNAVDYTFALKNIKCNSGYLMMTSTAVLGLPAIEGYKLVKVEATNSSGCSTSTQVQITSDEAGDEVVSGGAAQTFSTTSAKYTYTLSETEENTMYYLIATNKNCQLVTLVLYYEEATPSTPKAVKPTFTGDETFLNSTSVSLSTTTEGASIYYTMGDAPDDPTTSSTPYEGPINVTATTTIKAIAVKADMDNSPVAEATFTKATIMTVAEAKAAIEAGGDLTNKYVAGIISKIDSYNSTYHSITYWISDNGTTTDQLQVYSGLAGVVKNQFASEDDLAVGDDVTVKGTLKKYQSTYEFDKNNVIVAYKPIALLSWSAASYDAELGGSNSFPTLTNTNSVSVTYSSSNTDAATIDRNTGAITLVAAGTTTITAAFAGNETYKANSVSYSLKVKNAITRADISFNVDGGSAVENLTAQTSLPNPLPTTTKAGKNFGGWYTDAEKTVAAVAGAAVASTDAITLYAKWLEPYTVAEALDIIDGYGDNETSEANLYVAGIISSVDSYNSTYKSITYYISVDGTTTGQLQVYSGKGLNGADFIGEDDLQKGDNVIVYGELKKYVKNTTVTPEVNQNSQLYYFNRPTVDLVSIALPATASVKVGKTTTLTPVFDPENATDKVVSWASENASIATVDNGVVTGVSAGTVNITVTYVADPTINATCAVTVSEPLSFNDPNYEWQLVTSDAQLVAGKYYVIGNASAGKTANKTITNGYLGNVASTIADGAIAYDALGENTAIFELGGESGAWTLVEAIEEKQLTGATTANLVWDGATNTTWPISIDDENAIIGASAGYRVLYNVNNPRFKPYDSKTSASMVLPQLYVWALKTYKLRYDANGGENAPAAQAADGEGKATVTDAKPTYTDHIFNGWNTLVGGNGEAKAAGDVIDLSAGDVTLYAQWREPNTYSISYDANGGTLIEGESEITPTSVTEGNAYTIEENVYEVEGKLFIGWKANGVTYNAGQEIYPTENMTFVAQWGDPNVTDFMLVTDVKQLKEGDKVYIVAADYNVAMGTQNDDNYRNYVEIAKQNNRVVILNATPVEFTVGKVDDNFTFNDGTGYLYASSSSSNNLDTEANLDDNGKWAITIDADGVASIIAQGDKLRNDMRYNASSGQERFSCYATSTTMKAVSIYKRPDYTRNVSGNYATICLPKAGQIIGATLYEIAYYGETSKKIFFDEIVNGEMEAGIPYIFQPAAGVEKINVYYSDNTAEDVVAGDRNGLIGFYNLTDPTARHYITPDEGFYILYNNQYWLVSGRAAYIANYRAYIRLADITPSEPTLAPGRRRISMSVNDTQTTTGFENAEANEAPHKVLINGELFILRGEKMYDAKGQLVK